jgi:uncharacterized YccA/Bax inhibitor family protein
MALFKSGNPTLKESAYQGTIFEGISTGETMSVRGTLNKFGFLFLMMTATTLYAWKSFYSGQDPMPLLLTGVFGGLVVALIIVFKKQWSPYLAPAYALLEGLFVGAVSAYYDYAFKNSYPGIIMHAVSLTLLVTLVMYALYHFRIIKVTQKLRSIVVIATISIALFYLITWVLQLGFHVTAPGFLYGSSLLGIGFSVAVICLAALNLLLDFDMIEKGVEMGAPKYMEWYSAFGLLVTLVWLYLEILRLLSKISRR